MVVQPQPMKKSVRRGLLVYLLVASAVFIYLAFGLWSTVRPDSNGAQAGPPDLGTPPAGGAPAIVQIDPTRVVFGVQRPTLRVFGHNFDNTTQVLLDAAGRNTSYISPNELVAHLETSDFAGPGTILVTATQAGQTSNPVVLTVGADSANTFTWRVFFASMEISSDARLLLLVMFMGAFSASLMALRSLADYRGERKLFASWAMHYVVRPPLGAGIAVLFYLVIRGGLMADTDVDAAAATPYGLLAVATLAGLFEQMAVNRLRKVATSLFGGEARDEGLRDPKTPQLESNGGFAITSTQLPDGQANVPYPTQKLVATGGTPPYHWTSDPLPPGLTLDPSGELSGTPTAAAPKQEYQFKVKDQTGNELVAKISMEIKT